MTASNTGTETATATAATAADTVAEPHTPRRYPILKTVLQFGAAMALGFGVVSGLQYLMHPAAETASSAQADFGATAPTQQPYQAPAARPVARPQVIAPKLNAAVIIGSSRFDNPGQLALPTDSVFALSLGSGHSGLVEVYAINPDGQSSHLWSARIQAGQDLHTPNLRLEGMRGTETLRIVFRADEAANGQRAATVVKQIRVLHV